MALRLVLLFVAINICFALSRQVPLTDDAHNIQQCPIPEQAKAILCQKDVIYSAKFLQVIDVFVDCPESGINIKPVTCIIVTNRLGDDGGEAKIVSGGIGYTTVEVELTSKLSKGLDYHIEIYTA